MYLTSPKLYNRPADLSRSDLADTDIEDGYVVEKRE
jgi:hypothetical protein